ncbi:MAG: ribonuclease E/G, partial [Actinomycetes bacterium]
MFQPPAAIGPAVVEPVAVEPAAVGRVEDPGSGPASIAEEPPAPARRSRRRGRPTDTDVVPVPSDDGPADAPGEPREDVDTVAAEESHQPVASGDAGATGAEEEIEPGANRRRRRRGGRGRRRHTEDEVILDEDGVDRGAGSDEAADTSPTAAESSGTVDREEAGATADGDQESAEAGEAGTGSRRRRRRRRRGGTGEPDQVVEEATHPVSRTRAARGSRTDEVSSVSGSTRLEAKRQRRKEGRDAGRRRPAILTESEFLARREAVERVMVIRQRGERTQIAVLEDSILVEHYVTRSAAESFIGNVYLGRVQNVLPSMEAAFIDIGKGRNAVLYAGEVNWDAAGLDGQPRRIELALKSGDTLAVQVTKDPVGAKGSRLTSQISLPGRYLVYVPDGGMSGVSRKLPDVERTRLKSILKRVVPEGAGVIVRTAAEGAREEELTRDVARLTAQWEDIQRKATASSTSAPALLYGEPDLTVKVVRDLFNDDCSSLIVSGQDAWETVQGYVGHVAPELLGRVSRWEGQDDVFAALRVDEQLGKALDRKVWLPSGGYLVID